MDGHKNKSGDLGFPNLPLVPLSMIALIAAAIVAPMCFLGNASGHDFQPHLASWIEVTNQWREGISFPRWAVGANYGFGEPRFIFYPPLSALIGAALGLILPWKLVPAIYVWLCMVGAGLAMLFCARQWLSPRRAVPAALLFAANPYHLVLIYYRSAYAELLASAFFPLVVAGAIKAIRGRWPGWSMLSLAFAAIWLSNAPAAVITTYSLAVISVAACVALRSVRPLLIGGTSMIAGFGLSAFYIVPAWWEQRWIQISGAISTTYNPEHNFLFSRTNEAEFNQFNWKVSAVAVVLIVLTSIAVILSRRWRHERGEVWWILLALSIVGVLLMLPVSAFAWRYLPELHFLQFPWRWLLVLGFSFALFAASVKKRSALVWLSFAIVIVACAVTIAGDTSWDSEDVAAVVTDIRNGRGYEGIEGFQPRGAKVDELDEDNPLVGEVDPDSGDIDAPQTATINIKRWGPEEKSFAARADEPVRLALRLLHYPAWELSLDGKRFQPEATPQTGQIVFTLPPGLHQVEAHFRRTQDRLLGGVISIITVLGVSTFAVAKIIRRGRVG
jgi:hypothetical protein